MFKTLKNWINSPTWKYVLIGLFALSRLFIWVNKPEAFSEIIYSYMPYAHLWASGVKPYLEQWYEYPPATIPLFYIPHWIDMHTHGTPFHSNYSYSYRGQLLLIDILLFWLMWKTLRKQKVSQKVFTTALLYYMFLTAKATHFVYDTMDITFAAAITLGVAAPIVFAPKISRFMSWLGFFLGVALKYVNAPLAPLYALLELKDWQNWKTWRNLILSGSLAFVVIWGVPLALYRSSLQVTFVYHNIRGIQIDSAPAIILRTLDRFYRTEKVIEVYKNYEIAGPMTDQAKPIVKVLFPVSIALFLVFGAWLIWKTQHTKKFDPNFLRIHLTLGYVLLFMLTGKVLSTPFLLWHLPLFTIYPFKDIKEQLKYYVPSALIIFSSMTRVSNMEIGIFPLPLIMGWIRTLMFVLLFGMWVKTSIKLLEKKK